MIDRQKYWTRPAALALPLAWVCLACGPRDNTATTDSAGGASDSAAGMVTNDSGDAMGSMGGSPNNAGMTDPSMAQLIAVVNRGEVTAGTLASTKARNADVKAFARDMVTEHRKAQRMLDSIAGSSGWQVDSASMASGMSAGMSGGTSGSSGGTATGSAGSNTAGGSNTGTGTGSGSGTGGGTSGSGMSGGGTSGGGTSGSGMSATNQGGDSRLNTMIQQIQQTQQTSMQQLRSASGAEFDRSYMDSQLAGHQQVLDLLNQYMNNVQSNQLRTYVTDVKNSVEKHKARAQEIKTKLGSS